MVGQRLAVGARRAAVTGAALLALVTAGGGQAHASAACDAVNGGALNQAVGPGLPVFAITGGPVTGFAIGERLTFTVTNTGAGSARANWDLLSGNGTILASLGVVLGSASDVVTYTVTGNNQDTSLEWTGGFVDNASITATCTPVATPGANTDSARLRALQVGVSKLVGDTSGAAITGATDTAINSALNGGGNPVTVGPNGISLNFTADAPEPRSEVQSRADEAFAALGYAKSPVTKAPPLAPVERVWSVWADIRGTGWDRNNFAADLRGNQLNITAGVGRKLTPNLVVGVLAGYEHFKYDVASLLGTMKGDGATIGGYAGWRITTHLRWDATLAWSRLSYDAVAGTAAGSFDGSRILASTGLTGTYRWAAVILEPSARVYALWEHEDAYTDTLGTLQAARNFSVGRVSAGGKAIYPWLSGDLRIAPYVGLYGDYRFSSDNALPVGQPVVWIGDGLSARVTGGVTVAQSRGGGVALGGELGGLGADYKVWSVNGRVFWPF